MQYLSALLSKIKVRSSQAGFTMIELLIVISILGILAVAVLSAINPVEQINRGRDTGSKSDAEQLIGAIDRYNAFKGYFPWVTGAGVTVLTIQSNSGSGGPAQISDSATAPEMTVTVPDSVNGGTADCNFLNRISNADAITDICPTPEGTQELKSTFINRITDVKSNPLYIYNRGQQGDSTYVCYLPKSKAFLTEGQERCGADGAGLPSDLAGIKDFICDTASSPAQNFYVCLP